MTTGNDPNERLSRLLETPAGAPFDDEPSTAGMVDRARERAQDVAEQARERAQDVAEQARRRAEEAGRQASTRVDSAMTATGDKMSEAARTLREKAPDGQVGDVANSAARALEAGGDYLRRADVDTVRQDLEHIVREHPIESLAVGVGLGFLLARTLRSRRSYYG